MCTWHVVLKKLQNKNKKNNNYTAQLYLRLFWKLFYLVNQSESEVAQSCPTLCSPMDCSPPGSSVHRIFQERVLEWVAISFSRRMIKHVKCLRPWLAQSKCLMSTYYIIISNGSYSSLGANI